MSMFPHQCESCEPLREECARLQSERDKLAEDNAAMTKWIRLEQPLEGGHSGPDTCPVWNDGCNCTLSTLVYYIERAERAESELAAAKTECEAMSPEAPKRRTLEPEQRAEDIVDAWEHAEGETMREGHRATLERLIAGQIRRAADARDAEWREVVVLVRDGFRTMREDPDTAKWICDEILKRLDSRKEEK